MKNRREAIKKLATGAAALGALALLAPAEAVARKSKVIEDCDCESPDSGPLSAYFTNAIVQTHDHRKALFYNDLLKDKIVMINFMSIATEAEFESTQRLLAVQDLLGDRLGKDYFIYSITIDPLQDTPIRLNAFAEKMGVKPGWTFLTGKEDVIDGLKTRFFFHPGTHQHAGFSHHHGSEQDCSMGLMRYGNVKTGTWASVPNSASPDWIIKRLDWVRGDKEVSKTPKRKGPFAMKGKPWLYDSGNYTV